MLKGELLSMIKFVKSTTLMKYLKLKNVDQEDMAKFPQKDKYFLT